MGIDQKRRALAVTLLALNTRKGKYVEDTQKTRKRRECKQIRSLRLNHK